MDKFYVSNNISSSVSNYLITSSDIFESFRKRLDLFGCVRMCSDTIGCVSVRWEAFRHFWKSSDFFVFLHDFRDFGRFGGWGAYFTDVLRLGSLLLSGLTIGRFTLVAAKIAKETCKIQLEIQICIGAQKSTPKRHDTIANVLSRFFTNFLSR